MAKPGTVLAIDQGTTSSRAIVFGADLTLLGLAQREFAQHYPASGWVEHDPDDIWRTTVETARQALTAAKLDAGDIAAIGITNQRETCVIWDRRTGRPIHLAIVLQDRRTAEACRRLKRAGHEPAVTAKTGLLLTLLRPPRSLAARSRRRCARAAKAGHLASAPSTLSDLASPAARCTPPTPPTLRARYSTTSPRAPSTTISAPSTCRARCARDARLQRPTG
jgi:sugar (pentulose or hexulose) kinase